MNYRHSFHAGNFADVVKHAILALCLAHLREKPAPFRVIDTHAGAGRYDLAGPEAGKTLEWVEGIGRLVGVDAAPMPGSAAAILAPYLDIVGAANPDGRLSLYPGSPAIARAMLRTGDNLVVNELHPQEHDALAALFCGDRQVKSMTLDGWMALKALLPPKERRGLVLIDPPFERRDDLERLGLSLGEIRRRFATGTYLLWLPIKDARTAGAFHAEAAKAGFEKTLQAELLIRSPSDPARLNGCAMMIVNPPWTLRAKLEILGPFLAERLAQGPGAAFGLR